MSQNQKNQDCKTINQDLDISGSIEDFYQFKNPLQLAKLMLEKSQCKKFFYSKKQQKINKFAQSIRNIKQLSDLKKKKEQHLNKIYKQYKNSTVEEIYENYKLQNTISKDCNKIFLYKMQKQKMIFTDEQRIQVWVLATLGEYYKKQNPEYYQNLLKSKQFPDYFEKIIIRDVKRTQQFQIENVDKEKHHKNMQEILFNYSKRNSIIGYCQGLNYIVSNLLQIGFKNEDCFWILTHLIEQILPVDYYPNTMIGVLCDQKIFNNLLQVHNSTVFKLLEKNEIPTGLFLTQWFVCIYSQTLNFNILKVAWDHLLIQGSVVIFKIGLIILDLAEKNLKKAEGMEILQVIQDTCNDITDAEYFNKKLSELYISKKGVEVLREIYRQMHNKELQQVQKTEINEKMLNFKDLTCNDNWAICTHQLETERVLQSYNHGQFILRQGEVVDIIDDYFDSKNIENLKNHNFPQEHSDNSIIIVRQEHICNDIKDQNTSPRKNKLKRMSPKKQRKNNVVFQSFQISQQQSQLQNKQLKFQNQNSNHKYSSDWGDNTSDEDSSGENDLIQQEMLKQQKTINDEKLKQQNNDKSYLNTIIEQNQIIENMLKKIYDKQNQKIDKFFDNYEQEIQENQSAIRQRNKTDINDIKQNKQVQQKDNNLKIINLQQKFSDQNQKNNNKQIQFVEDSQDYFINDEEYQPRPQRSQTCQGPCLQQMMLGLEKNNDYSDSDSENQDYYDEKHFQNLNKKQLNKISILHKNTIKDDQIIEEKHYNKELPFSIQFLRNLSQVPNKQNFAKLLDIDINFKSKNQIISAQDLDQMI